METLIGTTYKLNIHIEGIPSTMDDIDFTCEFSTGGSLRVTVDKADMVRLDANNYIAVVDSSRLGRGRIYNCTTVRIPDTDCPGGIRTEIYREETDIVIR